MKTRILVMLVVVSGIVLAPLWAADITGTWKGEMAGRGGQAMSFTFNFKADGPNLTGTSVGPMGNENSISEGKIEGDSISFVIKVDMQGNELKINYKGKVAGDEIRLTMQMEGMGGRGGGPGGGPGGGGMPELVLKKVK